MNGLDTIFQDLARCNPAVARGEVQCRHCGRRQTVDPAKCFRYGWPTCCGATCMLVEEPQALDWRTPSRIPEGLSTIPWLPGYFADTAGHIHSFRRYKTGEKWCRLRARDDQGHWCINLRTPDGKVHNCHVGRLILEAFVGPCPPSMECCHNDSDGLNNNLSNLRWDTRESNIRDMIAAGHSRRGARCNFTKLTEEQARSAIRALAAGEKRGVIARRLGVGYSAISEIAAGRNWAHLRPSLSLVEMGESTVTLTLTDKERVALELLRESSGGMTAAYFGAALWQTSRHRQPQHYARPGGRMLHRMERQGLCEMRPTGRHRRRAWYLTRLGQEVLCEAEEKP